MKKAFDQTVRDLKREVNKKVLKVPGIEQKVLDATSNEPWGPHGSSLSDIAQATRNYHEYQMIMAVLWKRINDTGKNWRHVYKALTVLEYLVAHGSERVIEEIREHAYQISTLSDFQYIDSSGRDQGSNVRKKSQSLVALVNDKERIQEAREKALVNRDKFRNTTSPGGMYKPSSGGYGDRYDDDRYGSREDDRNGYGREREYGYREDDRRSRDGDSYSRDGDRYARDSDERYGSYKDDDYRGRNRSTDNYQSGPRSRSSDRYRERGFDDDGRYSSRSSDARAEDHPYAEGKLERKFSEQNIGAPPSYEEAVSSARSPVHDERDGDAPAAEPSAKTLSPTGSTTHIPGTNGSGTTAAPVNQEDSAFDEFDPRGAVSAGPLPASSGEMDLLGSLSDALAIVPATSTTTTSEAGVSIDPGSGSTFVALSSASTVLNQPTEDPFGESPFKAIPSADNNQPPQNFASGINFQPDATQSSETFQPAPVQMQQTSSGFDFGDTFEGLTFSPSDVTNVQVPSTSSQFFPSEPQNVDVLADILPPPGPTAQGSPFLALPAPTGPPSLPSFPGNNFAAHSGYGAPVASQSHGSFSAPPSPYGAPQGIFSAQGGVSQPSIPGHFPAQSGYGAPAHAGFNAPSGPPSQQGILGNSSAIQSEYGAPVASQGGLNAPSGPALQQNSNVGNFYQQTGPNASLTSQAAALSAPTGLPAAKPQPAKDKFETKSTVWADTLSRGLVNLNISGPKTNPLADIGVDFDSINRKEKREKPIPQVAVTSTINMGKAMGSGSGLGRAGASALASPNPMMGSSFGMSMGGGGGMAGTGMVGYRGMNQQPGMGIPMGLNNMGGMQMGMNNMSGMQLGMNNMGGMQMGMNNMQPPQQGPPMPGYNPMMGSGGYPPQNPYGGYQ